MVVASLLPSSGRGQVLNLDTLAEYATLHEAVAALSADGQTLELAAGVYEEPELTFRYAVTVRGAGSESTTWKPAGTHRLARVEILEEYGVTAPVVLEGLTLRDGQADGHGGHGGALRIDEGLVVVRDCLLTNNVASASGGAIWTAAVGAGLTVEDSRLAGNVAGEQGGAALRGTFARSVLEANQAAQGGATAYAQLDGCTVQHNQASQEGGGLYLGSAIRSELRGNRALFGGGASGATLASALVVANEAAQRGGGAHLGELANCTVVANSADTAGGGLWGGVATNTLFHDNKAPIGGDVSDESSLSYSRSEPAAPGAGNTADYPRFRDPIAGDYTLLSHSPAVDAGDSAAAPAGADLAGNARIQGAAVDLGAFEHDPAVVDFLGFQQWLQRNGLPTDDPASQLGLDHDDDGIANGFAFAFGPNRVDGALLTLRRTAGGVVAETAPQAQESVGFIDLSVVAAASLEGTPAWSPAEPVEGAPEGAARYRRSGPDADLRGFFRLKATLP